MYFNSSFLSHVFLGGTSRRVTKLQLYILKLFHRYVHILNFFIANQIWADEKKNLDAPSISWVEQRILNVSRNLQFILICSNGFLFRS